MVRGDRAEDVGAQIVARNLAGRRSLERDGHFSADLVSVLQEPGYVLLGAAGFLGELDLRSVDLNSPFDMASKFLHTRVLVENAALVN